MSSAAVWKWLDRFRIFPLPAKGNSALEGLSEQRTRARELLKRAFHRAPLIDEFLPTRQGLQIFFTHNYGEKPFFIPFFIQKKIEKHKKEKKHHSSNFDFIWLGYAGMWIGMSGGMTQHYAKDLKRKKKHTSKEYGWT